MSAWYKLDAGRNGDPPPSLPRTLLSGQCFRWRRWCNATDGGDGGKAREDDGEARDDGGGGGGGGRRESFVGVIDCAVIELRATREGDDVEFRVLNAEVPRCQEYRLQTAEASSGCVSPRRAKAIVDFLDLVRRTHRSWGEGRTRIALDG